MPANKLQSITNKQALKRTVKQNLKHFSEFQRIITGPGCERPYGLDGVNGRSR